MSEFADSSKKNPLAIWSFALGIASLFCLGPITGIPAVICGHMARSKIKKSGGRETGRGIAMAGICVGYLGIILTIILAAITVPKFLSYRKMPICLQVESQAKSTAASLACYLSKDLTDSLPSMEELKNSVDCGFTPSNDVIIQLSGTPENIRITAYGRSENCQLGHRYLISIPKSDIDGWR